MKGKRVLSLALAALMTLSLLVVPAAAVSFTDMTNHWAKDDVEYLATQGVVKGTSATTFAPDQKMTPVKRCCFAPVPPAWTPLTRRPSPRTGRTS
mgnify:CR=1 FL=1